MKQARRKELKTNELSLYLQQIRDAFLQYSNYIIGGVVAVVLILVIALYVQSQRAQVDAARWAERREIEAEAAVEIKPETIERAERLAREAADDPRLGPVARELHANLAYQRALDMSPETDPDEYTRLLNEARSSYQTLVDQYPDRPDVVARARLGLGAVLESLHVVGQGELDAVAQHYRLVAESENPTYAALARRRLETLSERARPLNIVATRPAETQPVPEFETPTTTAAEPRTQAPAETEAEQPVEQPVETSAEEPAEEPATAPKTQPATQP